MTANFKYSLRFTLDPESWDAKKEAKLLDFCKKGRIDDVAFFINPEELNQSHLDEKQNRVWLKTIQSVSLSLKKLGITTSLNPWTTLMHSDRGRKINPKLGFSTMVDYQGKKAESIACPGDPIWQNYIADCYRQFASIQPNTLWVEDDFRHYNHTPLKLGCFCDRHMQIYNQKLGKNLSRQEFIKLVLQTGKPTQERLVYLETAQQEMIQVAKKIAEAVRRVSPRTKIGLMSSFPNWHAIEDRDWSGLFDAFSGEHPRVNRPHLPAYNEVSPLKYSRDFEAFTRTTAAFVSNGPQSEFYPELENYMYSPFAKSNLFTQFQLESTVLIGASGIFLNLFDMMGNGIDESYHYAQMLADSKTWLNHVSDSKTRLNRAQLSGVMVLMDQNSAQTIHTSQGKDPEELLPNETNWLSLFGSLGIASFPQADTRKTQYHDQTVAISGQFLRNLNNAQISQLVKNNTVFLDGECVQVLLDRKLAKTLLSVNKAEWHQARTGYQSFEQADGQTVDGIENPRITMLQHTGDYLQLAYTEDAQLDVISNAYNEYHKHLGPMMTVVNERTFILPMNTDPKYGWESQYYSIKEGLFKHFLEKHTQVSFAVEMPGVKLVIEQKDGFKAYLSNFTIDDQSKIKLHLAEQYQFTHWILHAKNGSDLKDVSIHCSWDTNGIGTINYSLKGLETILLEAEV
ncbi:hypothetical protein [Pediococcus parvulus]|uniref:hypothetical protein n=1 Tax=Pediococcus parvulus TaxID=54062 RepID=UPI0021A74552|nr:hypothetical protein [Pediococcus parvulus]MCT3030879.1 hypothetical protein [Pediococcus parvulus]